MLQPVELVGKIEITDQVTVQIHLQDFVLNVDKVIDSHVGNVHVSLWETLFAVVDVAVKAALNGKFAEGVSLEQWLHVHHVDFIDLNETDLWCEDGYLQLFSTPFFNLTKAN